MNLITLHNSVALLEDIETCQFMTDSPIILPKGQVGTVVEIYKNGEAYEVEFSDQDGQAYALVTILAQKLICLHYEKPCLSTVS
ncbi:DUF4926 domain-containing protein [Gloeocapsa sp. PCC 73106]|uniref:DUF4926 domain-containing protein n=1 Tax=Gloeocapsa sp. PCC 73106 TaxID=102232 RepID=UPI0002AC5A84|nr:DUF4926 domain-containing protein [Gloeocapsa sp. PCC 73106]ELR99707.1 hypothetical protein GLO73106DRAFT_00035590 [Gloeocapsa sp. PCC 73106]